MGTVSVMANRKLEVVRRRLQREMERVGIDITIHRQKYESDGSNGYVLSGEETTFVVKGILKSLSGASAKSFKSTDGGKTYTVSDTLSVLYEEGTTFQMNDWFIHGNVKYTIAQASNVGEQNVYWLLGLTLEPQEVMKYGE